MILYRAMCKEEMQDTLRLNRPAFRTRYKWFSTSLEHIKQRIQDGSFNNSKYIEGRYDYILVFHTMAYLPLDKEIQIDRRSNIKMEVLL